VSSGCLSAVSPQARALALDSSRELLYLTWRSLPGPADVSQEAPECISKLCSDILLPALNAPFLLADKVRERNIWIGCSVTSQIHFDALDNLHVCLQGSKIFHLLLPLGLLGTVSSALGRDGLEMTSHPSLQFSPHMRDLMPGSSFQE